MEEEEVTTEVELKEKGPVTVHTKFGGGLVIVKLLPFRHTSFAPLMADTQGVITLLAIIGPVTEIE